MSYLLRHHAVDAGIDIRPDGYVRMADLLAWQRIAKLRATREEIHQVVQDNDKKRFHIVLDDGEEYVRAAQGHSITVGIAQRACFKTFHGGGACAEHRPRTAFDKVSSCK